MKRRKDAGFSLAALIFFATAISILLSAAVPAYQMQAKRDREEELIFRGEEYSRAIQKYQRKFMIYPQSIDALLQTNGIRFLRRAYKDPITGKDFRLIYINADGTVTGSTLLNQRMNNTQPLMGGQPQQFSQSGQPQGQQQPQQRPPQQQAQQQGQQPAQQQQPGFSIQPQQQGRPPQQNQTPGFQQPTGGVTGSAGIIGVASDSSEASIKVYNTRQKYNEWEFIGTNTQTVPGQTPPPAGGGQQPPSSSQTPPPLKRP